MKKQTLQDQSGFGHIELLIIIVVLALVGTSGWLVYKRQAGSGTQSKASDSSQKSDAPASTESFATAAEKQAAEAKTNPASTPAPAPTPAPKKSTTPTPAPTPVTPPAAVVNTTNCLPPNPSVYATYYIHMNNSQYLQTNSYGDTSDLYAALQFAGLIDEVNTKQYVVLAPNDWNFTQLTQAQRDWMNASPANMKSVLGWQIVTSCITYDGVNPVKGWASGRSETVNTVNGPVSFTFRSGGYSHSTFGAADVAIWDWFTSNGSVTFTGFVKPPVVP